MCPASNLQGKNKALADAGAIVPDSFEAFEGAIARTFKKLVDDKMIQPQPNVEAASIPLDLDAAKKAGKVTPHAISIQPLFNWPSMKYDIASSRQNHASQSRLSYAWKWDPAGQKNGQHFHSWAHLVFT